MHCTTNTDVAFVTLTHVFSLFPPGLFVGSHKIMQDWWHDTVEDKMRHVQCETDLYWAPHHEDLETGLRFRKYYVRETERRGHWDQREITNSSSVFFVSQRGVKVRRLLGNVQI